MRLFLLTYLLLGVVFTFGFLCVMLPMKDHKWRPSGKRSTRPPV